MLFQHFPFSRCIAVLSAFLFLLHFGAGAQGKVTIQVTGLDNNKGTLRACLFNSEASFSGKGAPVSCLQLPVSSRKANGVFLSVPPGTYAISVFHDENNNNKLDTNFMGIPKEGYGASGNKLPFASAPEFGQNKFQLAAGQNTTITIRVRNIGF